MGLGSRGRAVDASGWLTLRRDRLFFLSLATRQRTGTLADSHELRVCSWSCGLCAKWSLASEISK